MRPDTQSPTHAAKPKAKKPKAKPRAADAVVEAFLTAQQAKILIGLLDRRIEASEPTAGERQILAALRKRIFGALDASRQKRMTAAAAVAGAAFFAFRRATGAGRPSGGGS